MNCHKTYCDNEYSSKYFLKYYENYQFLRHCFSFCFIFLLGLIPIETNFCLAYPCLKELFSSGLTSI